MTTTSKFTFSLISRVFKVVGLKNGPRNDKMVLRYIQKSILAKPFVCELV